MNDTVLIVLIIAIVVVVILVLYRDRLSRFFIKGNRDGIEAEMETRKPTTVKIAEEGASTTGSQATVVISGNKQVGKQNTIDVGRDKVNVQDNVQLGQEQGIVVRPDPTSAPPTQTPTDPPVSKPAP